MAGMLPIEELVKMVKESCDQYQEAKLTENEEDQEKALMMIKGHATMFFMKESGEKLGGTDKLMDKIDEIESQSNFFKKVNKPDQN
jgi:hypothetical protein